jgi:hypothetical protein
MKECTVLAVRAAWAPPIIKDGLRILEGPSLVQGGAHAVQTDKTVYKSTEGSACLNAALKYERKT